MVDRDDDDSTFVAIGNLIQYDPAYNMYVGATVLIIYRFTCLKRSINLNRVAL